MSSSPISAIVGRFSPRAESVEPPGDLVIRQNKKSPRANHQAVRLAAELACGNGEGLGRKARRAYLKLQPQIQALNAFNPIVELCAGPAVVRSEQGAHHGHSLDHHHRLRRGRHR